MGSKNSGDESDLTPLARAMRSRKRPASVVSFPGLDGAKVAIVNPSDEELAEAQAAATQYLKSVLRLDEFQLSIMLERNLYEAEEQRQILERVLRDPANTEASFATVAELREFLTPDTRKILMRHLAAWVEKQDPEPKDQRDPAALQEFVSGLKGEGALFEYLTCCDSVLLRSIVLSLADLLPTRATPSSTDTSSSNLPSDITSDGTSETTDKQP